MRRGKIPMHFSQIFEERKNPGKSKWDGGVEV